MAGERGPAVRAAVGGALILAGAGAGVAGAFAASTSGLVRAGGAAVGAVAGLAAAIWADRAYQRREAKEAALRARGTVLDALVADPVSGGSVFDVLLATSTGAAPFRGRRAELASLERWWADPARPLVVVTGPAGIGKTRLVTQFALDRPEPWVTGWLAGGRGADAVAAVQACDDPALILVDDADQRPDLAALLASLKADPGTRPTVRAMLIGRAAGLASRLSPVLDDRPRGILHGVRELPLGPFGGADDRARWFGEAVRAYARARQVPPPDLPGQVSGYITDPAEPILTLQAQALLVVLDSEGTRPMRPLAEGLPFDEVATALFAHEQHRWQATAQRPEFGVTDLTSPVQAHAVAVLLLASPAGQEQAVAVLRDVLDLRTATDERLANIARWAAHLYPGDPPWPIQIKPDMLAEWFAITRAPELAGLLRVMDLAQQAALLVLVAHASDHMPQAVQLFAGIVATDPARLAEAAVIAALAATEGRRWLDGELANLILRPDWSVDALALVEDQLTDQLPRTRAAIGKAGVKVARAGSDAASLARALQSLGVYLSELGRYQEALAVAEEAVGLWRKLARDNPAHQPDLARALNSLGVYLYELRRNREWLAAAEEAVGRWRQLARDNPAHQPGLAHALVNLGFVLRNLGRHREALAVAEEAVGLWRELAGDDSAYQPGLAQALTSLGADLFRQGRQREALAVAEEAVGLWRKLARDNPAHQPGLALVLSNLGFYLSALGRNQEALAAAEEAVGRYREVARDNPAQQPHLAGALNSLGPRLSALGRHQEALAAAEEAVGPWRELAEDNPVYQRDLAAAVNNVAAGLFEAGRRQEALAAVEEAVGLWREAARDDPAHQPGLAETLTSLGIVLSSLGRHQEALAAGEEAVGLYRELARDDPGTYQETYERALARLRRDLLQQGQESASILLHLDDGRTDRSGPAGMVD